MLRNFFASIVWRNRGRKAFESIYKEALRSKTYLKYIDKVHGRDSFCYNMLSKNQYEEFITQIKSLKNTKDKVALDIGCGPGLMAQALQEKFFKKVIGLDFCEKIFIDQSDELVLVESNIEMMRLEKESFDFIYCIDSFYHLRNPKKALNKIINSLKKDGLFVLFYSFTGESKMAPMLKSWGIEGKVDIVDFTDDDLSFWKSSKQALNQFEQDFYNEACQRVFKAKKLECDKFLKYHDTGDIHRKMLVLKRL